MQSMFKWDWPCMRELRLRGAQRTTLGAPLFSLLSCMPQLRIPVVELTLSGGEEQRCFWPADDRLTPFPCPELEQLTLANSVAHDQLWGHISHTLRTLSLPSCSSLTQKRWLKSALARRWRTYVYHALSSSEVLSILRRCPTPVVTELELEYRVDAAEHILWQHIAASFPRVVSLQIRRYRAERGDDVPVESIAQMIAPLAHLKTLKLNLDFSDTPVLPVNLEPFSAEYDDVPGQHVRFARKLETVAETLVSLLSPLLDSILLLTPRIPYAFWTVFHLFGRKEITGSRINLKKIMPPSRNRTRRR